ncbi:MAG: SusC family TonB-dependent receptor [Bacteroidetes bacterium HLUCCA01]|nr:MAG: SusC family TonB-dependent receptor [Bacteroidetes bacterium HLUCCA01]
MKRKIQIALWAILCFTFTEVYAQGFTVSGTVTDAETGEPLPGVNVAIPSLNRGDVTDLDGRYAFQLASGDYELVATYVGYQRFTQPLTIANGNVTVDIQLEADVVGLDQVVVVGYGEVSRRNVTGAITSVRGDDIQFAPVNTVENAIQGRMSGVFIQQNNGKLGQGIQMRIRGSSSVSASNQPLYVIDGVPVVMDDFSISAAATNPLAQFNFNDVESIQVLKDASAAAIYGSRAANGVVLITTKQGQQGRTQFNYSFQTGFSEPTNTVEMMNSKEYINYMYQAAVNTNELFGVGWVTGEVEDIFDFYSLGTDWRQCLNTEFGGQGSDQCVVDTDWQSLAFQDASMASHDLSASGGNNSTRFFVSGHYSDQDGILINDRFQRIGARINLDHQASDRISMGLNLNTGRSFNARLSTDNAFSTPIQLIALMPISPLYVPEAGNLPGYTPSDVLNDDTFYYNGIIHRDNSKYEVTTMRTTGTSFIGFQLMEGMEWRSEFSADIVTGKDDQWYSPLTARGFASAANGGFASMAWQQTASYRTSHYLNFNTNLSPDQTLDVTVGGDYQYNDYTYTYTSASGFPNDSFQRLTSAANVLDGTTTGSEYSFLSYFARANYSLNDRYLISASGRLDGSSRFGSENRYGFFPAVSAGWIVTEESFADSFSSVLNYLKARASFGITGNAAIGNFGSRGLWGGTSYGGFSGIAPSQIPNPNLTWETTNQFNIGFDFGFLNNRISGEVDYYVKNTDDLLLNVQIPSTSGFTTSLQNVGSMENKGWELVLNTINVQGPLTWTSNFNISNNQNTVTNLDGQVLTGGLVSRALEGESIGVFFAPEFAGVDPENGNALFNIYNDEACTDFSETTTNYNAATRCVIGNPNPDFVGGLGNQITYRGLSLSVLFQFVYGNDGYIGGHGRWSRGNGIFEDNSTRDQLNSWTPENTETNVPQARFLSANGNQHSSRYISDASYMRLKNVTLGYEVPRSYLNNTGLTKVRLYATGVNLLTWTNYEGWDPEMNTDFLAGNISLGTDFYTAPQARTITFGVDIGF